MQNVSAQSGCGSASIGSPRNHSVQIGTGAETERIQAGCQRIETENSAVIAGTFPGKDFTPLFHATKKSTGNSGKYQSGINQCRRHRAFVMREVPLYMVPAAIRRGVAERGGKMYRVVIVRTHWNHYTVKIRCNTKKATGHRSQLRRRDQSLATFTSGEGDADG